MDELQEVPEMAMTTWGRLREVASQYDDSEAAARAYLKLIGVRSAKVRDELLPVLSWAMSTMHRSVVRGAERQAFGSARREVGDPIDMVSLRADLVANSFILPDGRKVAWLEATEVEHGLRIEMLQRDIAGIAETIARHEWAILQIREHRVTCLGEIRDADVA